MKHYVLLNFTEGYLNEEFFQRAEQAFSAIVDAVPEVTGFEIKRNIVTRDSNADVMIRVDLKSNDDLKVYLEHPIHVEFATSIRDHKTAMTTFDCED